MPSPAATGHSPSRPPNTLATPASVSRLILDDLELTALFDETVFSSEVGLAKPRREMFAAVAAAGCTTLDRVVHVGDSLTTDVHGALDAGCRAVLFHAGRVIRGTWKKKELTSPLQLSTKQGDLTVPGLALLPVETLAFRRLFLPATPGRLQPCHHLAGFGPHGGLQLLVLRLGFRRLGLPGLGAVFQLLMALLRRGEPSPGVIPLLGRPADRSGGVEELPKR